MHIVVLGAGIIGTCTAWYLRQAGHEVTVLDRQPGAALETSYANGGQISVSYCEPWASRGAPWKVLKWLLREDAPLLFRPRLDPHQWRWGLRFLGHCHDAAFERHVRQLVALGRYSQETLDTLVRDTGVTYQRLQRGILHFVETAQDLDAAAAGAALMRRFGVDRRVLSRQEVLQVEPALRAFAHRIAGGTYTPGDESGDAHRFTQALAQRAADAGVHFRYRCEVQGLEQAGGEVAAVLAREAAADGAPSSRLLRIAADAVVVAMGAHSAPFLRRYGVWLNLYPAKGYSATLRLLRPQAANVVSLMDDARKLAISRLGDTLRIAGTAELSGYDATLDSPTARARCAALIRRCEELFPGVADTAEPRFWAGLRPSTPDNLPLIGRSRLPNLWLNTGHGTLGWTHGAGSGRALAALIDGRRPALDFRFQGEAHGHRATQLHAPGWSRGRGSRA